MRKPAHTLIALLLCMALPGCYVKLYGHQSTSGGTNTTTTASQVSGSAKFAGGKVSFSSGQVPPPNAPGGHVSLGKGASAVLVVGLIIADLVNYIRGEPPPKPLAADAKILETCTCYQKPVSGER